METPLTPNEALSGIFGSISLAAWVFVLVPQLYENFRHSNASGISLAFLTVWLIGDVTNLAGAVWASLVPTVVALAVYFCAADAILILQVVYYNHFYGRGSRRRGDSTAVTEAEDEEEPLLSRRRRESSAGNIGLPGSHKRSRRRSSAVSNRTAGSAGDTTEERITAPMSKIPEIDESQSGGRKEWMKNTGAIVAICVVGGIGWLICYATGLWTPAPAPTRVDGALPSEGTPLGAEILGYVSAVAYLSARIPQIVKNWRDQSCEGLSLLFFLLSLLGNLTYGAGIIFHSVDRDYIIKNLPWLVGSLGTIAEDVTIFVQFKIYGDGERPDEVEEAIL